MKKLRHAESSIEGRIEVGSPPAGAKRRVSKHTKKRNKKINKSSFKNRINEKKKESQIKKLLIEHLGSADAITEHYHDGESKKKRYYVYKCNECGNYISEKLRRHLMEKHKYDWGKARLMETKMRVFYLWCHTDKHQAHLPLPCGQCSEWHMR